MIRRLVRFLFRAPQEILPPPDRSCLRQAEIWDNLARYVSREERKL